MMWSTTTDYKCLQWLAPAPAPAPMTEEELKEFFKSQDTNGDGGLDKEELRRAFKRLGACFPPWPAHRGLGHADQNRDGFISGDAEMDDLVKYARKHGYTVFSGTKQAPAPGPMTEEELKEFFKSQDTNGDDRLDKEELKRAFKKLGSRLPPWRAARGLVHADQNGDGFIRGEAEMDDLVKYARKHGYTILSSK